jgi:hypothetical protein
MFPTGVFVKADLDNLAASLPERLISSSPSRLTVESGGQESGPDDQAVLILEQWSDVWCHFETGTAEDLTALVIDSLVLSDPVSEVISCHYRPDRSEYSYALFREGQVMETFESRGPSFDTVNFTSEIRKVQLQSLLKASDFMTESMNLFGIDIGSKGDRETRKITFTITFPGKRTLWQVILGAVSSK